MFVALHRLVCWVEANPLQFLYVSTGEDVVTCEDVPNGLAGMNPDSWLKVNKNIILRRLKIFLGICVLSSVLGIARDEISKLSFMNIRIKHLH